MTIARISRHYQHAQYAPPLRQRRRKAPDARSWLLQPAGSAFEVGDAMLVSAFLSNPALQILPIEIGMSGTAMRACSSMVGAVPEEYWPERDPRSVSSDWVSRRMRHRPRHLEPATGDLDRPHHPTGSWYDSEAELQRRMNPAAHGVADAVGLREAHAHEFLLQFGLNRGGHVHVAGHHRAPGEILRGCAADENGTRKPAVPHRLAQPGEHGQGRQFRAVRAAHAAATASRFPSNGARYRR
ncbi:hypothetical protein AB5I41_27400 [Sphingomonas sp. MMS24-JH45]